MLYKVKDNKPNPSALSKNLTNRMPVTEIRNRQIFQLKSLLSWLLFQRAYQLVHVPNRMIFKAVSGGQPSSLQGR